MSLVHGARPETRYVETDLGFVASQIVGEGERTIFFVTGALTNLDAIWDEPSAVRFFDRLRGMGRIVLFDMRGSGVSDPVPGRAEWQTIEEVVDDLQAVAQAAHGGVLVSGTVKDLVVGSGIEFAPAGMASLKGIPGDWALFELRSAS